jgi:AcrR family transcriptional regulator
VSRPTNLDRRLALLDTVVHHLGEHGVRVTSLRGIAKDLGMHPNVLVHHFGTRTDLMRAALNRALALQLAEQERHLRRNPGMTQGELIRAWWKWVTSSQERLALARIGIEAMSLPAQVLELHPGWSRFSWEVGMRSRLQETGLSRSTAATETARITALVTGLVLEVSNDGSKRVALEVLDNSLRDLDGRVAMATGAVTPAPSPDASSADPEGPAEPLVIVN